ncbi:hypothetical protein HDV05_005569 [Chytridiales sp. JEL 0842]|nr:hypothetical protein HDV05_005569 [Chytridiales sp. JEL 0842]
MAPNNLWYLLPIELRKRILDTCDPLTQYLNLHGKYDPTWVFSLPDPVPPKYSDPRKKEVGEKQQLINDIWRSAFLSEWVGDFRSLPGEFKPSNYSEWYDVIRTQAFWTKLVQIGVLEAPVLENIALRNCWLNLLDRPTKSYKGASVTGGHLKFMMHLESCGIKINDYLWKFASDVIMEKPQPEDFECLLNARPSYITHDTINRLARDGHLEALKFLLNAGYHCSNAAAIDAATAGHLNIIQHLHHIDSNCFQPNSLVDPAAATGHFAIVKFLLENRSEGCSTNAMNIAARNGHLRIVEYLHLNRSEGCTTDAFDLAAKYGRFEIVKFLHKHRREGCTTGAMDNAARSGHINIVRFLHEFREEGCTTRAMNGAAAEGHLNMVKFLHEFRKEGCTTLAMDVAAEKGHFDVVKFLHENRFEGCTTRAMNGAALYGHLDIVKYLHENRREGCSNDAIDGAANNGHIDVVRFLLENRIEGYTSRALKYTTNADILELLRQHPHLLNGPQD